MFETEDDWEPLTEDEAKEFGFFENYMNFHGRIGRIRYFMIVSLIHLIISVLSCFSPVLSFFCWCSVSPYIFSLMVKRLHDSGKSAWFLFFLLLSPIMLVLLLLPGDEKKNKYGNPPLPLDETKTEEAVILIIFMIVISTVITFG